jgi:hypothetical protein
MILGQRVFLVSIIAAVSRDTTLNMEHERKERGHNCLPVIKIGSFIA